MEQTTPRPSASWKPQPGKLLPLARINIQNKASRQRAKATTHSTFKRIRKGLAIGWRMNTDRQGTWTGRLMADGSYTYGVIGNSDELTPADGVAVFDYEQAVSKAIKWASTAGQNRSELPYSVSQACDDWLGVWDGSEDGKTTATGHCEHWIKPVLGDTAVTALTTAQIQRWLEWMASQPPKKKLKSYDPNDPETIRKRRDTSNRICNTLIAILNRAFKMRPEITSDAVWRKIEKFENVAVEKQEFLEADEVQNLLSVCDTDFAHLVFGSIASGMRYTEQTTCSAAHT